MKHAYLIIANRNPSQLQMLIDMIEDYRNDIYILVDSKSHDFPKMFHSDKSKVIMLPRIPIYWGDVTQIKAELKLLECATQTFNYSYYHLVSGLDLPLVTQDEMHRFFDSHPNKEFIGYNKFFHSSLLDFIKIKIRDRKKIGGKKLLNKYKTTNMLSARVRNHFFKKSYRKNTFILNMYRKFENNFLFLFPQDKNISFASQWVSIDNDLATCLVESKEKIIDKYKNGVLVDEIFLPTFINENSKFKERVYSTKKLGDHTLKLRGNLRFINWNEESLSTGSPGNITINDYSELMKAKDSGYLFARKFDINEDREIIDKLYKKLLNERI